jgi:uncharacterized protein (DUF927 family)
MRGHKDGGLRETGTWKTIALTTGEKPLSSNKSFSGQQVRAIEVTGGLTTDVVDDIKVAADSMKTNYGHFVEPFFRKLDDNRHRLVDLYEIARKRYITTDNVKTNRMANSFAALMVAGMLVEDVFNDVGIEPIEPHEITDQFFKSCVVDNPIENYSIRALKIIMDWIQSRPLYFCNEDRPTQEKTHEFYGWITKDYIDIIPAVMRKTLDTAGFDSVRTRKDWSDAGLIILNSGRNDYRVKHNDEYVRVVRFVRESVNNVLFQ